MCHKIVPGAAKGITFLIKLLRIVIKKEIFLNILQKISFPRMLSEHGLIVASTILKENFLQ
jgi:hypothetical protein